MHILVIGAGVVGVTTAWELHQKGYEVTVIDAADAVAAGASHANGGQIAIADSAPWSHPGLTREFLTTVFKDAPYKLKLRVDPFQWYWLYRFWRNCRPKAYKKGVSRNWDLAKYSQKCLAETRSAMGNDFDYADRQEGILQLVGAHQNPQDIKKTMQGLSDVQWLEGDELAQREPALQHAISTGAVKAAIWGMRDESGDAAKFSKLLADYLITQGVKFRFGLRVTEFEINRNKNKVLAVHTACSDILKADGFVIATGTASRHFAKKLGVSLPILPMKGYSLTVPILDYDSAPKGSLTDLSHRLVITRLGDEIRAAGFAEIGQDEHIDEKRIASIHQRLVSLFPTAADYSKAKSWVGFRPMTPDGAPIIGRCGNWDNVWLNTGHGTLGWTLSHGTAKLLADSMSGKRPELELKPYLPARQYS